MKRPSWRRRKLLTWPSEGGSPVSPGALQVACLAGTPNPKPDRSRQPPRRNAVVFILGFPRMSDGLAAEDHSAKSLSPRYLGRACILLHQLERLRHERHRLLSSRRALVWTGQDSICTQDLPGNAQRSAVITHVGTSWGHVPRPPGSEPHVTILLNDTERPHDETEDLDRKP